MCDVEVLSEMGKDGQVNGFPKLLASGRTDHFVSLVYLFFYVIVMLEVVRVIIVCL